MKNLKNILIVTAGIAVFALVSSCNKSDSGSSAQVEEEHSGHAQMAAKYVCPMHAKITSDKPGKCSECGMALKETGAAGDHSKHDH
ncbi:MAG: hypothetical protein L3J39_09580 [Verrucomicrobiales bacterium]|nr:hypothetical protein [Verrucomicrobiales bacterium]